MVKKSIIYLDHAAATPIDPKVLQAMQPYFTDIFYNPSATYTPALEARKALENARATVAHWLGVRSSEIIFTAGGTEANNLAIHGIMRQFPKGNIAVSSIEHESVLGPADNYDCRRIASKPDGRIDLADLSRKIDENTVLVSVMYANNEIGTIQPIREIAKIVAEKRVQRKPVAGISSPTPLYFHTDACQAANYLDLHAARLGVDLLTINAGKIYGPKQSGALYVKAGVPVCPLIHGGGQERGLRPGTESVAAAIGLAAALELVQSDRRKEATRVNELQRIFLSLIASKLTQAVVNGSLKYRLPNNVHLTLPGQDNERLLFQLDDAGILTAAGSACSAGNQETSHVLRAIGLSDTNARSSLRLTLGRATNRAMIEQTIHALKHLTKN